MTLPPGQRERDSFPRFGLLPMATRFPRQATRIDIEVTGLVEEPLQLTDALRGLPRAEQTCDFHCVTTWSRPGLRWGGVRFTDFHHQVLVPRARPHAQATLVAPAHYGYKWAKHLCRIEFRREADGYPPTGLRFMDHPRARVALEERARGVPGWLVRVPYRLFIPATVARFAKALAQHQGSRDQAA